MTTQLKSENITDTAQNAAAVHGDELSIRNYARVFYINNLNDAEPNLLPTCRVVKTKIAHSVFVLVFHSASSGANERKTFLPPSMNRQSARGISCWQTLRTPAEEARASICVACPVDDHETPGHGLEDALALAISGTSIVAIRHRTITRPAPRAYRFSRLTTSRPPSSDLPVNQRRSSTWLSTRRRQTSPRVFRKSCRTRHLLASARLAGRVPPQRKNRRI